MGLAKRSRDDADRRAWIVETVAAESRAYIAREDGLGEERRARAINFIDAGYTLHLLNEQEARSLQRLMLTGETQDRAFLRCLDPIP